MAKKKFMIIISLILALGIGNSGVSLADSKEGVSVFQSVRLSPVSVYDEENLLKLSIEDAGKYHGDICLCLTVVFRATQLAISQLWSDEIPKREDFKIISALPTQGSQDCFEFIARVKTRGDFILELPEGTDAVNLLEDNWSFTFIRKSTGEQIRIHVKEGIFPEGAEGFLNVRKKVKFEKTATKDEKETFELAKQELKNIFMNLSADKLFEFKKEKEVVFMNQKVCPGELEGN